VWCSAITAYGCAARATRRDSLVVSTVHWHCRDTRITPVILANSGHAPRKPDSSNERNVTCVAPLRSIRNPVALTALARREFGAGNAFEARAFSERRLAAAPADPKALLLASQIEQKLGDSAAAARYVSRLKAEFPDAPEARNSAIGDGGRQ
jgi:type IV pilus assembly protein PilF